MFYSNFILGKLEWLKRNTFLFFKREPFFSFFTINHQEDDSYEVYYKCFDEHKSKYGRAIKCVVTTTIRNSFINSSRRCSLLRHRKNWTRSISSRQTVTIPSVVYAMRDIILYYYLYCVCVIC